MEPGSLRQLELCFDFVVVGWLGGSISEIIKFLVLYIIDYL